MGVFRILLKFLLWFVFFFLGIIGINSESDWVCFVVMKREYCFHFFVSLVVCINLNLIFKECVFVVWVCMCVCVSIC